MRRKAGNDWEQRFEDFGEELEALGRRMEHKGMHCRLWFDAGFGVIGPVLSSILSLIVLVLVIWLLNSLGVLTGFLFLQRIGAFFAENLALFFLLFLFFSAASYVGRCAPRPYLLFQPLVKAIGFAVWLWVFASLAGIANSSLRFSWLAGLVLFIKANLIFLFLLFLALGYLFLIARSGIRAAEKEVFPMVKRKSPAKAKIKRLYRSGEDKILGGVCGGIAEYLNVDPVIIRLLWVIAALFWGAGILAYIIAWIIIPRNPAHKWN